MSDLKTRLRSPAPLPRPAPQPLAAPAPLTAVPLPLLGWPTRDTYGTDDPPPPAPNAGGFGGGPAMYMPVHPAGEPRGRGALEALAPPPADHPMMTHAAGVRSELAAQGLPTDAKGVRVVLLGEEVPRVGAPADHGPSLARTVAGPAGLAQGARVELPDPTVPTQAQLNMAPEEQFERMRRSVAANMGQAGVVDTMKVGVDRLEQEVTQARVEIDGLTRGTPKGGQTTVASISRGQTATRVGLDLADSAIARGNTSPLVVEGNEARVAAGLRPLDVSKEADAQIFRGDIIRSLTRASENGEGKQRLDAARAKLGESVARARDNGIVTFAAAGNEHAPGTQMPGADRSSLAGTPGLIMVGASDVGDPKTTADDRMADFSNSGAQITAPGVKMPVGAPGGPPSATPRAPEDVDGTSYSAPYAASVAALMVRANPKITPAQIESILTSTARDQPGEERDGAGMIDPTAAVKAARALAP